MSKNRSNMTHQFSQVPKAEIQRSSFDRSSTLKTTFNGGFLVPIFVDEALPGDTFNLKMTAFSRLATPIFPYMDNLHMETFFFAVPMRLLWDNWEKFNGAQSNPGDSTDFLLPQIVTDTPQANQSLWDYFGLPTQISDLSVSAMWHRGHNLIFNEWFRDENLQNSVTVNTGDGPDNADFYELKRRGKRHDYFTSALPWPQKGPAVDIPLGGQAPVHAGTTDTLQTLGVFNDDLGNNSAFIPVVDTVNTLIMGSTPDTQEALLYADLSQASAVTINSLREAFQLQKMYERDARGGTRYTEIILSHFLVSSPDARLQRPEYLGGGSSPVNIQPVPQTTPSNVVPDVTPQGNLAGYGTAKLHNHGFTKSFTEHSIIIGYVNVRADLTYQQGLDRMWSRSTRFDFYWPALAHLGEQEILNKEIFTDGTAADDAIFGYNERYAEYRYKPSKITGKFRSNDPQTLDAWHLAQDFANLPVLGDTFIQDTPPIDRVVAVTSEPQFLFDAHFSMRCARPMPLYGVPGNVDRF